MVEAERHDCFRILGSSGHSIHPCLEVLTSTAKEFFGFVRRVYINENAANGEELQIQH